MRWLKMESAQVETIFVIQIAIEQWLTEWRLLFQRSDFTV